MIKRDKTVPIRIVTYKFPKEWTHMYVVPLFDGQIGDPGFDEVALDGYIEWILNTPNAVTVLGGDWLNSPIKGGKTDDYWEACLKPQKAKDLAADKFKPLKDRILAVVDGNHEDRVYRETGTSPTIEVLSRIGFTDPEIEMLYDPKVIIVRIQFGIDESNRPGATWTYSGYLTHGWGGARKSGGQVNKMEELGLVVNNADFYMIGHEHTLNADPVTVSYIPDRGNNCMEQRQVYVLCGGFCRYTRFQKGIARRLPDIGAPRIRLEGISGHRGRKDIHVSV